MSRTFIVENAERGTSQLCIRAHDMSLGECRLLRGIVTNQHIDHPDNVASYPAHPFLQGYREPWTEDVNDGWCLVEFWTRDREKIDAFVAYVNSQFADAGRLALYQQ